MTLNCWSSSEISLWWSCSTDLPRTLSSNTVALPNSSSVSGISPSHFATLNFPYSWAPAITVAVISFRRLLMSVRWAKNNTVRGLYLTSIYIQLHTALSVCKPKCLNYIILFFYWMSFFHYFLQYRCTSENFLQKLSEKGLISLTLKDQFVE